MEWIRVNAENLEKEHICCAIAGKKDCGVLAKKAWLQERFQEGLVFLKGNVRGKCFIEYIPAEYAWSPVRADGYMYINCLWVAGQFKGQGFSSQLLDACIRDSRSQNKHGLCILSAARKMPFLADPGYLKYKGFCRADAAPPYFELWYLPFDEEAPVPRFNHQVKETHIGEDGYVVYYTHQCPFTAKYVPLLEQAAREHQIPFKSTLVDTLEKAKNAPAAVTNFALFSDGNFVTNEILSVKKFLAMHEKR
ncbi:MAG: YoaP domain-containing protein [Lachnospiraceae bacterium]|nr:YoaP domain-containing protein [Lachnospiraceae bacterium]